MDSLDSFDAVLATLFSIVFISPLVMVPIFMFWAWQYPFGIRKIRIASLDPITVVCGKRVWVVTAQLQDSGEPRELRDARTGQRVLLTSGSRAGERILVKVEQKRWLLENGPPEELLRLLDKGKIDE